MSYKLKCKQKQTDCFAIDYEGKCCLLESFVSQNEGDPVPVRHIGTTFKNRLCPFYKTIEQAGGTYEALCYRYKVEGDE